jgi:hypothetical protein
LFVTLLTLAALFVPLESAGAKSASVTVTAQVAPVFSLTILTDGQVAFGQVLTGAVYTSAAEPILRVTSSRPWNFTDSSDATILLGSVSVPRSQVVRHSPNPSFGTGLTAGVHDIACTYTLDLTSAEARALAPGAQISTRLGYTVVQQ